MKKQAELTAQQEKLKKLFQAQVHSTVKWIDNPDDLPLKVEPNVQSSKGWAKILKNLKKQNNNT